MTVVRGIHRAEALELRQGKVAGAGQDRVKRGGGVPLAEDEAVTLRPLRFVRPIAQNPAEVQGEQDFHGGEAAGRMPALPGGHLQHVQPHLPGQGAEIR